MPYLIAVIAAVLLFAGFLMLTAYETRRGSRFFAGPRYRLDTKVARMFFVVEHVDWGAFTAHLTRTTATTLAHDFAHGTLVAVRAAERFLTRAVRALRSHRDSAATLPAPASPAEVIDTIEVKEEIREEAKVSVEPLKIVEVTPEPAPAEVRQTRQAPRSMDIPRRTKSKVRDTVQEPKENRPV